jgi:thymidylate synthase
MNADAFIYLMSYIAKEVGKIAGKTVHLGRYVDTSDSFHIYGKDAEMFRREFLYNKGSRSFEDRTYTSEFMNPMLEEAIPEILEKIRKKDAGE